MISVGVFLPFKLDFSIEVEPALGRLSPGMEVEPTHDTIESVIKLRTSVSFV